MRALERIVEYLAGKELGILKEEESVIFSLVEVYAEENGFEILKKLIEKIKALRVDVGGRRRNDLKQIALAMRVNVLAESRLARQTPVVNATFLEKILGGGGNE